MACLETLRSTESETGFGGQRPINSRHRVILEVNRRSILSGFGPGAERVAQTEPQPANKGNDVDHFAHRARAPVMLFKHGAVVVDDGYSKATLPKGTAEFLACVFEIKVEMLSANSILDGF